MNEVFCWFLGIDWGEKKHQVCLRNAAREVRGLRAFPHTGSGLEALVRWLGQQTGAAPSSVAVGIERPDGPVGATLLAAGYPVYALNPRQSNRMREAYCHAGHKSDEGDSRMLSWALRISAALFRRVQPHPELTERLRERTKTVHRLKREQRRQCQRIRNVLVNYFPQMVAVAGKVKNLGKPFFMELWERAPTPAQARRVRGTTLAKLWQPYGVTRISAEEVVALFREPALVVAPGATAAAVEAIRTAFAQLRVLNTEIARAEKQMTQLLDELAETEEVGGGPDAPGPDLVSILRSRLGLGDTALAPLLAWRFELLLHGEYRRLRAFCGVVPIPDQSGSFKRVRLRRAVPQILQEAAYNLAAGVVRWDKKVKAYNQKLKAEGKKTARHRHSIGSQQLRVLCSMARHRTPFDLDFVNPSQRAAS